MELTTDLTIRALTPEERAMKEQELEALEAASGICISCGS